MDMNRKTLKSALPVSLIVGVGCNLAAILLMLVSHLQSVVVVRTVHYVGGDELGDDFPGVFETGIQSGLTFVQHLDIYRHRITTRSRCAPQLCNPYLICIVTKIFISVEMEQRSRSR